MLILVVNVGGGWLVRQIDFQSYPRHQQMLHILLLSLIGLYILLMALPFMPGIEICLALLNLPRNALIGGGGGIGLISGMSKIIPFYRYVVVIAIATAPVPLIIFIQTS
ncbi:MAG: hypothetical protein V7752_17455 [Halopseudomonas sp.]